MQMSLETLSSGLRVTAKFFGLKDIARIELGALSYSSTTKTNGKQSIGVAIAQTAGSNAKEVIEGTLGCIRRMRQNLFPPESLSQHGKRKRLS